MPRSLGHRVFAFLLLDPPANYKQQGCCCSKTLTGKRSKVLAMHPNGAAIDGRSDSATWHRPKEQAQFIPPTATVYSACRSAQPGFIARRPYRIAPTKKKTDQDTKSCPPAREYCSTPSQMKVPPPDGWRVRDNKICPTHFAIEP